MPVRLRLCPVPVPHAPGREDPDRPLRDPRPSAERTGVSLLEGEGKGREQGDERKEGDEGMCSAQLACHFVEGRNAKHPNREVVDTASQTAA